MRSKNVYRMIVFSPSGSRMAFDREMASVVIHAFRDRYGMGHWAEHPAEWVLLSLGRIACNAAPCRRCRRPWQDFQSTSTVLSTTGPSTGREGLSVTRRRVQGSSHRAEHKLRAFPPPQVDRRHLHLQNQRRYAVVPRAFRPVPSSLTWFRNADSPSGMP